MFFFKCKHYIILKLQYVLCMCFVKLNKYIQPQCATARCETETPAPVFGKKLSSKSGARNRRIIVNVWANCGAHISPVLRIPSLTWNAICIFMIIQKNTQVYFIVCDVYVVHGWYLHEYFLICEQVIFFGLVSNNVQQYIELNLLTVISMWTISPNYTRT